MAAAPLLLLSVILASSWLPPEEIRTTDHRDLLGYVLSTDGGWYSILTESPRYVTRLPASDVASREICHFDKGWFSVSLADLARSRNPSPAPSCPEPK
jgi:hypothetical protein